MYLEVTREKAVSEVSKDTTGHTASLIARERLVTCFPNFVFNSNPPNYRWWSGEFAILPTRWGLRAFGVRRESSRQGHRALYNPHSLLYSCHVGNVTFCASASAYLEIRKKAQERCWESQPGILLNLRKCPTGSPYVSHSSTHFCTISACHPPHLSTLMFCCVLTIFSLYLLFQLAWIAFLRSEHRNIRTHFHNWTLHWPSATGFPTIIVIVIVIVYQYATKCVKEEAEKWNLRTFTFSQS